MVAYCKHRLCVMPGVAWLQGGLQWSRLLTAMPRVTPLPHPIRTGQGSQQNTAGRMPDHFLDRFINNSVVFPCSVSQISPSGGSQLPCHDGTQAAYTVAHLSRNWGLQPAAIGGSHLGSRSSSPLKPSDDCSPDQHLPRQPELPNQAAAGFLSVRHYRW